MPIAKRDNNLGIAELRGPVRDYFPGWADVCESGARGYLAIILDPEHLVANCLSPLMGVSTPIPYDWIRAAFVRQQGNTDKLWIDGREVMQRFAKP